MLKICKLRRRYTDNCKYKLVCCAPRQHFVYMISLCLLAGFLMGRLRQAFYMFWVFQGHDAVSVLSFQTNWIIILCFHMIDGILNVNIIGFLWTLMKHNGFCFSILYVCVLNFLVRILHFGSVLQSSESNPKL